MSEGTTATDLVLTVTQMLRKKGVVGKFVEFYGDALANMTIEDQATIANMAPEYGATCGFFPVSPATLKYLRTTPAARRSASPWSRPMPRAPGHVERTGGARARVHRHLELDISTVQTSLAGPRRPQDRVCSRTAAAAFAEHLHTDFGKAGHEDARVPVKVEEGEEPFKETIGHGDVVIAAITSCTNTSNPSVLIAAGLVAQEGPREGPEGRPLGEDVAGPRLAGRLRVPHQLRPPGSPSTPSASTPRGLWLHDLHRQRRRHRPRASPRTR